MQNATVAASAATRRTEAENLPPIELARKWWVAFLEQDAESLRRYSLPNPELYLLWQGDALPPDMLETGKRTVTTCPGRILNPGDSFVAFDRLLEVQTYEPAVYCPVYLEWPVIDPLVSCRREREGDRWRVDAGSWVAARKAAARVRAERAAAAHPVAVPR